MEPGTPWSGRWPNENVQGVPGSIPPARSLIHPPRIMKINFFLHSAGFEPAANNLEGCRSNPTELRIQHVPPPNAGGTYWSCA